jgi:hypothetical protein
MWQKKLLGSSLSPVDDPDASATSFPDADGTLADSINLEGEVTGFYMDANAVYHGFLWLPPRECGNGNDQR